MLVKRQESRVESQKRMVAVRSHSGSRLLTLNSRLSHRGVTLIELLIVIMIISILAALVLGVAAVAMETARQSKSRHTVTRLHTLVTEFYDTFKTRRVKLRENGTDGIETQIKAHFPVTPVNTANAAIQGNALAEARLYAMREMMLMDVPDRWSDVLLNDVGTGPPGTPDDLDTSPPALITSAKSPFYLNGRTALSGAYLRRYASLVGRKNSLSPTGAVNTAGDIKRNQWAECLYMVVTMACGDGEARSLFAESSIGDIDGDGAPEFLDGWGHPINFLRWAPGFDSQIQLNANTLSTLAADASKPTFWATAAAKDHDPFDMYRRDSLAFRLVPLIYSPGRDESSGLASDSGFVTWRTAAAASPNMTFSTSAPYITLPRLDPYAKVANPPAYMGTSLHLADPNTYPDETSTDDVHNHMLGLR
jgi:prepilin-type N-terminal cleavage/methylation domain-containing protein